MKRSTIFGAAILFCIISAYGCAAKKISAIDLVPNQKINIVGEYEFERVGVGVGHGFILLPGLASELNYGILLPGGGFTFYKDNTFKINFVITPEKGSEAEKEYLRFDEIRGTYKINSEHTITLKTIYGNSEYLYSINNIMKIDSTGKDYPVVFIMMMPSHPWFSLRVGNSSSKQGRSLFEIIYLSRKVD